MDVKLTVPSMAAMDMARSVVGQRWPEEGGVFGLVFHGGWFYEWYGDKKWVARDESWMENEVWRALDGAVMKTKTEGGSVSKEVRPNRRMVGEVVRAVKVVTESPFAGSPVWIGGGQGKPKPERCVAFQDVVVDVDASVEKGEIVTMKRDRSFFGPGILGVEWGEGTDQCPVWDEKMREWSGGEEEWVELRERAYGYCLMADRNRDKILFEFGKPRSGKGMGTNVVLKGLLGTPAFAGVRVQDFVDKHGLDGLEESHVVCVGEVSDVDKKSGRELVGLLKGIAGQDEVPINPKGVRIKRGKTLRTMVILQSNEVPDLPNAGGGLSSKLLPLHFGVSAMGREDTELREKLRGELKGIAQRLVRALVRLETDGKWPMPESSRAVIDEFNEVNNVFDAFLRDRCVKAPGAWVSNEALRDAREAWEADTGLKVIWRGNWVSRQHWPDKLVRGASWDLRKKRNGAKGSWGVEGIQIRFM